MRRQAIRASSRDPASEPWNCVPVPIILSRSTSAAPRRPSGSRGYPRYVSSSTVHYQRAQPLVIRITRTPRRVVASLVYSRVDPEKTDTPPERPVGIDAGVAKRITLSDGRYVDRREVDRRKLRRLQRRVARTKRGSAGRRKKVATLAREWQRISERNRGDEHQISATIVHNYDFIAVEDLQIGNMVRSAAGTVNEPGRNVAAKSGLNRAILDQSWGRLYDKVEYQAARAGIRFVRVPPHNTSRACSACGAIDAASRRSQAVFRCTSCGHAVNADVNAATIILRRGLDALGLAQCIAKPQSTEEMNVALW